MSTKIYCILIAKVQNNFSLIFISKICLMTIILTGQQSTCYHVLLHIIPICDLFTAKSQAIFYFSIKNFILLEKSYLHRVLSVIYRTKTLFVYFMNMIVVNVYGRT